MNHWDEYWATSNSVHSFAEGEYDKGYDGEVLGLWNDVFASMPNASVGLDVGCGNGGLALIGVKSSHDFTMYGCDAANIKPLESVDITQAHFKMLRDITFLPNMKAEELGFEDRFFDFAVSQFGIEYSDLSLSVPQLHRVLKPKGSFVAVIHHKNSFISQSSRTGINLFSAFFKAGGIIEQLEAFVSFYSDSAFKTNAHVEENAHKFKAYNKHLLNAFKELQKNNVNELSTQWYNDISKLLVPFIMSWQRHSQEDFEKTKTSLQQFSYRLAEQLGSAKSKQDLDHIIKLANHTFASATYKPVRLKEGLFGWCLTLTK